MLYKRSQFIWWWWFWNTNLQVAEIFPKCVCRVLNWNSLFSAANLTFASFVPLVQMGSIQNEPLVNVTISTFKCRHSEFDLTNVVEFTSVCHCLESQSVGCFLSRILPCCFVMCFVLEWCSKWQVWFYLSIQCIRLVETYCS